ncbi:Six-hairpin glycosidase-like protein [Bisporella sp. PMI_857]|nr:Six-hairpin glycosidase-like protein [Bisporella sp. PMI_857]
MNSSLDDGTWIWHPKWVESANKNSAGGFVHFRKSVFIREVPLESAHIQITADTKYKLYINSQLVSIGPVKGDEHLWFCDELDIRPYLRRGTNHISIRVLRFYFATPYATSFARSPYGGLLVRSSGGKDHIGFSLKSDDSWETALDLSTRLPTNIKEDDFLHIYEQVDKRKEGSLVWVPAIHLEFPNSHGLSSPWKLSPRLIPTAQIEPKSFVAIHNVRSTIPIVEWERFFHLNSVHECAMIRLPTGSTHHLELEVDHLLTAWLDFRFERPMNDGSILRVTYSECYEDPPELVPYIRCKSNRRDSTKKILGPVDQYIFGGKAGTTSLHYDSSEEKAENFAPFHFRTFRFIALDISVAESSDLVMTGVDILETHYPLQVLAELRFGAEEVSKMYPELFETSIRTLKNCMHDCYEDCPFYEQLQYAMDVRSSAIFTYAVSSDDRLARQAIIQLHNSYSPNIGLTTSRAPSQQKQIIPHFSLFWICMVADHFEYFGDADFTRRFLPACDGIFDTFARRIDPTTGLVRSLTPLDKQWDFVDWTKSWKPFGVPPQAATGFQTYTNSLYAYSLKKCAIFLDTIGRPAIAVEYLARADAIARAIKAQCFDGCFFTDGLASTRGELKSCPSQTNQVWAVLCGAISGEPARELLSHCLSSADFVPTSSAMSFYVLRALSMVGGGLYDDMFHSFWNPWREQLSQGLTTWVEDDVSKRSDCHAWGSAPLYEFLAEVVGVRPALPGWAAIAFEPRFTLISNMNAKVPFMIKEVVAVVHVKWWQNSQNATVISFRIDSDIEFERPVRVRLPNKEFEVQLTSSKSNAIFTVPL